MVGHFGYFYSFGNPTCCSEVLNSPSKVGTNNGKYIKTSPLSFLRVKVLTGLAIEKERKCYSFCIFSTPVKKPVCVTPLPFGNLSFSDPPTPRNFRDPPWGGYGYFLEPHNHIYPIPKKKHPIRRQESRILWHATGNIPLYFPLITRMSTMFSYAWVLLRTFQNQLQNF